MVVRYRGPFGERGVHTVHFDIPATNEAQHAYWKGVLEAIPGVTVQRDRALCRRESAPIVASYLRVPYKHPDIGPEHLPGAERALALGLREKLYEGQRMGARFLAVRTAAYLGFACRTGKNATSLTAGILSGSKRVLVCTPSVARHGWNQDAWRWTQQRAFMFRGRSGRRARIACRTCDRTGVLGDGSDCPDCKADNGTSYGWRMYKVRRLQNYKTSVGRVDLSIPITPDPRGGLARCREHPEVVGLEGEECQLCLREFIRQYREAPVVISSYDLMNEQPGKKRTGQLYRRTDLPGTAARIAQGEFDLALMDEAHELRGDPKYKLDSKRGSERGMRVRQAVRNVPRVYMISATPISSYTRDLYSQFDIMDPGSFGESRYLFDERYCNGQRSGYGYWENKGKSIFAETELKHRMEQFMLIRTREQLLGNDSPAKIRQVILIEPPEGKGPRRARLGIGVPVRELLAQTLEFKLGTIVDSVMKDAREGYKTAVFTLTRDNAERVACALEDALDSQQYRRIAEANNIRVVRGTASVGGEVRGIMAEDFSQSQGANIWVGTIKAAQVGISLAGVRTIHMADVTDSPHEVLQVEERPNVIGRVHGLAVLFYAVEGSLDESIAESLVSKLPHLETVVDSKDAAAISAAYSEAEQSIEQRMQTYMAKIAAMNLDDYDDD